jgi:colanic acid biosynthesis glycosyl transferase WcaI
MRVCIINEFFYPENTGGTGTVLSDLARRLQDDYDDVSVDVITSRNLYRADSEVLPGHEDWHGIPIRRLSTPRPSPHSILRRLIANLLFSLGALLCLLRRPRYDVLLVGTAPPTSPMTAILYKWLTGTPYVYITYDLEPDRVVTLGVMPASNPVIRLLRWMQHHWLRAASRVVALGRCMEKHLIHEYRLPPEKIEVIPIGFDPTKVRPMGRCSKFRRENGLEGFVVLYAGNFGRYHNFDTILDAAKHLQSGRDDIQFVLVGNGAQRAHIVQRVEAEALTNVKLCGFVPEEDFADMLASADLFLVTLEQGMEGLCVPSKLYSTMAAGRATVALMGAESEVSLVVTESESGFQVTQGDVAGLVRVLVEMADAPEEAERMGSNARRALMEAYASPIIAHKYYQTLRAAVYEANAKELPGAAVVDARLLEEHAGSVEPGKR